MLKHVKEILENEHMPEFIKENEALIEETVQATNNFTQYLKGFVIENIEEFMEPDIETTYKNIRLFSEVATATFMNEAVHIASQNITETEEIVENKDFMDDYL